MSRNILNSGANVYVNTLFGSGAAIEIEQLNFNSQATVNLDIGKQNLKNSIDDTDIFVLETNAGSIVKVTGLTLKNGLSFWTEDGSNIYPKNVGQVLINTTTNTNNRNLLINGNAEIATNLFLSGNSAEIEINSNSSTGIYFKNTASQGFKLYAQNGEFGSPEFDMEDSRGVFRIKQTGTIKYELDDGVQYNYSDNNNTALLYFVKASNNNIGNYIKNDFTNNLFEFRNFTALTDDYFFRYNTSTDETTIPNKLILSTATNQLSNGTYDYILPTTNGGELALKSEVPTALWSASSTILTPSPTTNNKIKLIGSDSKITGDITNPVDSNQYPYIKYGSFETVYGNIMRCQNILRIESFTNASGYTNVDITCNTASDILEIGSTTRVSGDLYTTATFVSTRGSMEISDGSNFYNLPSSSGTLALLGDIPTGNNLWSASSNILSPTPSSNNKIRLTGTDSSITGDNTNGYNSSYPYIGYGSFQTLYSRFAVAAGELRVTTNNNSYSVGLTCSTTEPLLKISESVTIYGGLEFVGGTRDINGVIDLSMSGAFIKPTQDTSTYQLPYQFSAIGGGTDSSGYLDYTNINNFSRQGYGDNAIYKKAFRFVASSSTPIYNGTAISIDWNGTYKQLTFDINTSRWWDASVFHIKGTSGSLSPTVSYSTDDIASSGYGLYLTSGGTQNSAYGLFSYGTRVQSHLCPEGHTTTAPSFYFDIISGNSDVVTIIMTIVANNAAS